MPTHGNRTAVAVRALVHGGTMDMAPEAAGAIILIDHFVGQNLLHGQSQPRWRLLSGAAATTVSRGGGFVAAVATAVSRGGRCCCGECAVIR